MPRPPQTAAAPRGAALLLALIVITIATLMVVGAIAFTGSERSAAVAQTRVDRVSACKLAARNKMLSEVRLSGRSPTSISFDEPLGDGMRVMTGHLGATAPATTGEVLPDTNEGGMVDITNKYRRGTSSVDGSGPGSLLSTPYKMSVLCIEPDGRQHELEFAVRIGI